MNTQTTMPQDSRLIALLLAFISGASDVYSHIQYQSLVATQTGNFILMANDLLAGQWGAFLLKLQSLIFFTLGFLYGARVKYHAQNAYWRSHTIAIFLLLSFIVPFLAHQTYLAIALLAFGTGLIMQTFNNSKIEDKPYTVMVASGNYRKMLNSCYEYRQNPNPKLFRIAKNYSCLIISFISGVLMMILVNKLYSIYAIWLVSLFTAIILINYHWHIWHEHLAQDNR